MLSSLILDQEQTQVTDQSQHFFFLWMFTVITGYIYNEKVLFFADLRPNNICVAIYCTKECLVPSIRPPILIYTFMLRGLFQNTYEHEISSQYRGFLQLENLHDCDHIKSPGTWVRVGLSLYL